MKIWDGIVRFRFKFEWKFFRAICAYNSNIQGTKTVRNEEFLMRRNFIFLENIGELFDFRTVLVDILGALNKMQMKYFQNISGEHKTQHNEHKNINIYYRLLSWRALRSSKSQKVHNLLSLRGSYKIHEYIVNIITNSSIDHSKFRRCFLSVFS